MTFACDDAKVEANLRRMVALAEKAGARFHPALTLCAKGGEMWLESALPPSSTELVAWLPRQAMVPLEGCDIVAKGDALKVLKAPDDLSPGGRDQLENFITLYNLTGKARAYRELYPAMWAASERELFEQVFTARPDLKGGTALAGFLAGGGEGRLIAAGFLQTRQYRDEELGHVLMPVVDLANHHPGVLGLSSDPPGAPGHGLALCQSRPKQGSRECFVRYDRYDAMDLYLIYGYPEREAPYVRSVPLEIPLSGLGTIAVDAKVSGYIKGDLPGELAQLRPFLPYFEKEEGGVVRLSQLLIPVRFMPDALRTVLGMVIQQMSPAIGGAAKRRHLRAAERAVIERNVAFYRELADAFAARLRRAPGDRRLAAGLEVARTQLSLLDAYRPAA